MLPPPPPPPPPLTARARAVLFGLGFHAVSTAPLARMCAALFRATPSTTVNCPPIYQPPEPSCAMAFTEPFVFHVFTVSAADAPIGNMNPNARKHTLIIFKCTYTVYLTRTVVRNPVLHIAKEHSSG